jgi:hypothetical protein
MKFGILPYTKNIAYIYFRTRGEYLDLREGINVKVEKIIFD